MSGDVYDLVLEFRARIARRLAGLFLDGGKRRVRDCYKVLAGALFARSCQDYEYVKKNRSKEIAFI
jgi:hypothetical protein